MEKLKEKPIQKKQNVEDALKEKHSSAKEFFKKVKLPK